MAAVAFMPDALKSLGAIIEVITELALIIGSRNLGLALEKIPELGRSIR
jgi:hypothetical protein